MKRRSLLALIGLAPLMAVAASAVCRAATPNELLNDVLAKSDVPVKVPFIFNDGVLYMDEVRINSLKEISRVLGSVEITNAHINNLICGPFQPIK